VRNWIRALSELLPGALADRNLSAYTTFRIGGPAAAMVSPRTPEEVADVLGVASREGVVVLVLGLGSNVLLDDQGYHGIVLRPDSELGGLRQDESRPGEWIVGAGFPIPLLARRTAGAGWEGVQRLVGVPGVVGGGVAMNAGAHGQDFSQVVLSVDLVSRSGELKRVESWELDWRYRETRLDGAVVTGVRLKLESADSDALKEEVRKLFRWRRAGTPFDQPCCGSVFKNPDAAEVSGSSRTAGQLIDEAGLKGFRVGAAQVSGKHANYIVNLGRATSGDVKSVMSEVRSRVFKSFGIELHPEVKVIGPDGSIGL